MVEALQNLDRLSLRRFAIKPAPTRRLQPHQDVFGDGQVGSQRKFLVDERNPMPPRVDW